MSDLDYVEKVVRNATERLQKRWGRLTSGDRYVHDGTRDDTTYLQWKEMIVQDLIEYAKSCEAKG